MIRVAIVDDHASSGRASSSCSTGEDDIEVVGTAANGEAAHALLPTSAPGRGPHGPVDARRWTASRRHGASLADAPEVRVVVLTSFADRQRILDALEAGASGYLLKDGDPARWLEAVAGRAAGESPLDPEAARVLLDARREGQPAAAAPAS